MEITQVTELSEMILHYLKEDVKIFIPVLMIIGAALKRSSFINDNDIPIILGICGVVLSLIVGGLNIDAAIQGIFTAACAVGLHQTGKQQAEKPL